MQDLNSSRAPEAVGAYPHAKKVGNFLFLSGIGPRQRGQKDIPGVTLSSDSSGNNSISSYDIEVQCKSVFQNVRWVLEDAGACWEDLVDVTVFLTNMKKDFSTFNKLYADAFKEISPTRTTVEVGSLPTPIAVELKCVAYVGDKK